MIAYSPSRLGNHIEIEKISNGWLVSLPNINQVPDAGMESYRMQAKAMREEFNKDEVLEKSRTVINENLTELEVIADINTYTFKTFKEVVSFLSAIII